MRLRPAITVLMLLVVLLARTAGLHFHGTEHHHEGFAPAASHPHEPAPTFTALEADHLQDHADGAVDVDDSAAAGTLALKILATLLIAFVGFRLFAALQQRGVPLTRAPLRPPRPLDAPYILPPSQGPPLAA